MSKRFLVVLAVIASIVLEHFSYADNVSSSNGPAVINSSALVSNSKVPVLNLEDRIEKMQHQIEILQKRIDQLEKNQRPRFVPAR